MEVPNLKSAVIKLGYFAILAAAVMGLTRALITDAHTDTHRGSFDVGPNAQDVQYTLWNTRTRRIVIDVAPAASRIDVFLLDEEGIDVLLQKNQLQSVFSLEDVDGCDFTYQPQYRGVYVFVIQNRSNQTIHIGQRTISQGLEWDLLQCSGMLAVAGMVLAFLPRITYLKKLRRSK
jgi:hypothetical protein